MDELTLKRLIKELTSHVERIRAENIVLERSLDAMEVRDREIEASIPKFSYRYPWEELQQSKSSMDHDMKSVCGTEESSSEEEQEAEHGGEGEGVEVDQDQNAQIFHPETDLNLQDSMFAGMTDGSKEELQAFMLAAGDIAPSNFDVMRYKYANLIKGATAGDGGPNPDLLHEHTHHHHRGHKHDDAEEQYRAALGVSAAEKEPRKSSGRKKSRKSSGRKSGGRRSRDSGGSGSSSEDSVTLSKQMGLLEPDIQEPEIPVEPTKSQEEFPDFDPMVADELPLKFKNRFIEEQIPLMIDEWGEQRLRQTYKDSTRVLVYIDTYQTSYITVKQLLADLRRLHAKSVHPITKKLKAESLLLFMRHIKTYLTSEETKHSMEFNELRKHKHRIDTQLKQNEELGESLHLVDFEQLRIENKQLVQDIEEHHEGLQRLKLITAKCMEDLKRSKSKLFRQLATCSMIEGSIQVRVNLQAGFERDLKKREDEIWHAKGRIRFYRQRLRAFRAPNLLEYIETKAIEHGLASDGKSIQRKIEAKKKERSRVEVGFGAFEQENIHEINRRWLDGVKKEVEERGLMKLLGECDDEEFTKAMAAAGSKQEPVVVKAKEVPPERGSKHKPLWSTIGGDKTSKAATAAAASRKSADAAHKKALDMDDTALVKSRLPIPTPGNLLMLSQQQEKENAEIERLSRIKSEVRSAKSAKSAKLARSQRLQQSQKSEGRRPSTAAPTAPAAPHPRPRPSVAALPPGPAPPRPSIIATGAHTARKSVAIVPEGGVGAAPRASIAIIGVTSPTAPTAARLSKRRMTISDVKTRHSSKIKDEDQLIMQAGALGEAAAHQ